MDGSGGLGGISTEGEFRNSLFCIAAEISIDPIISTSDE